MISDRLSILIRQQYRKGFDIEMLIKMYKLHFIYNEIFDPYEFIVKSLKKSDFNIKKYFKENIRKYDGDNRREYECGTPTFRTIDEVSDFTENCKLSFSERLKITQIHL